MFVNRKIYEKKINDILFKGNETKGTIEAYNLNGDLIHKWDDVAHNFAQFESKARNFYNMLEKNSLE